jgi:hypothetical protein
MSTFENFPYFILEQIAFYVGKPFYYNKRIYFTINNMICIKNILLKYNLKNALRFAIQKNNIDLVKYVLDNSELFQYDYIENYFLLSNDDTNEEIKSFLFYKDDIPLFNSFLHTIIKQDDIPYSF